MRFYSTFDISQNLSLTPEGFLICKNVPLSRTGKQMYYDGEVPVTADRNGAITITRAPEDVFHPAALSSFEGKPVTMHHPEGAVTPDNWSELSKGHVQNVRRGDGLEADTMCGDILIMEQGAIEDVKERRIREVSCGYDADYIEDGPGVGRQTNIRGNHVALVPRGRCGSLCAIHDSEKGEIAMKVKLKGVLDKVKSLLTADEHKELEAVIHTQDATLTTDQRLDQMGKSIAVVAKTVDSLLKAWKDAIEEEEKQKKTEDEEEEEAKKKKLAEDAAEEEEKKKMATDAAPVLQEVLYRSSILAPDLSRPTMDSVKGMNKKTFDESICLLKRKSLDAAYKTEDGKSAITPFLMGKPADFMTMDCASMDVAFIGASEVMKQQGGKKQSVKHTSDFFKGAVTPASINDANKKFWDSRKGGGK
jgi:hypothetical protein